MENYKQVEVPVHDHSVRTFRSFDEEHPVNSNLQLESKEFRDLLREVKIRFDTNPKFYLREDYLKLIELLRMVGEGGGGGGSDVEVEIQGSGNVLVDLSALDNVLTATKGEVKGGDGVKTYFPDFACWQKPSVKKGALVLWSPMQTKQFGYVDEYFRANKEEVPCNNSWILIGHCDLDSELSSNEEIYFYNFELNTLKKRLLYLLENSFVDEDTEIPIKISYSNKIHPEDPNDPWNYLQLSLGDDITKKDYIGTLIFYFTVQELLNLDVTTGSLFYKWEDGRIEEEFYYKFKHFKDNINIFVPLHIYFKDRIIFNSEKETIEWKLKKHFYLLLYYKKVDFWHLTPIPQRTARVKYHTTEYYIVNNKVERRNYRDYPFPDNHMKTIPAFPRYSLIKIYLERGPKKLTVLRILNNNMWRNFIDEELLFPSDISSYVFTDTDYGDIPSKYVIISYGETFKKCGHSPHNGKWFPVKNNYLLYIYRRPRKLFYKSMIPLYRVYTQDNSNSNFVVFHGYLMPKIAY